MWYFMWFHRIHAESVSVGKYKRQYVLLDTRENTLLIEECRHAGSFEKPHVQSIMEVLIPQLQGLHLVLQSEKRSKSSWKNWKGKTRYVKLWIVSTSIYIPYPYSALCSKSPCRLTFKRHKCGTQCTYDRISRWKLQAWPARCCLYVSLKVSSSAIALTTAVWI